MNVGLVSLIQETKHPAPPGHPENAFRLKPAVDFVLESDIAENLELFVPAFVESNCISMVHNRNYLKRMQEVSSAGGGYLDGDTYLSRGSYEAAVETATATISAADIIMKRQFRRIFMAIRPPGHHAEYDHGMGFCLINNVAVAAEYLIKEYSLKRVAIVDWDIHHGNGTQHYFYDRNDVFFISLHQYPFYPGSGASAERGAGAGLGYTLNIPLPAGCEDKNYLHEFETKVITGLTQFDPEFIIISCGFDSHRADPLGGLSLTEKAFGNVTGMLVKTANKHCEGRILSVFEGGYNSDANGLCLYEHLKEMQTD
ncbi:MAG: histone deacetylase [Candidatus Zixiibacteriota bacterium]